MARRRGRKNQIRTRIIITGCVLGACTVIAVAALLINKNRTVETQDEVPLMEIEEIEDIADAVERDEAAGAETVEEVPQADAVTENSASEEASADSSEAATGSSGDADPQVTVSKDSGAAVDVAQIVSASSVGENHNITYGIDVSKFQGTIDWAQVAGAGIDFAMVRVGYRDSASGEIKADSNARFNMQEAEKNGIKIGAYFFSTAVSPSEAVEEANWVANYISQYPITYPVGFNCEGFENASSRQYNLTKDERSTIALAFLDQVYSAGYTPIFYASRSELSGDAKWNASQIEKSYKIWMAWYNQDTSGLTKGPSYEGQCAMWQYSNNGNIAGISKPVDVDVAYFGYEGTETAKDTSERETASADEEALMKFSEVEETVTAKNNTNLRNKPSQGDDSTVMTTLQNGQTALRTGISDSGWSRVVYEGNTYYAVSRFLTTDLSAPKQEEPAPVVQETSGFKTKFADCSETVTAKELVNLRNKPSVTDEDSEVIATLSAGDTALRTGINNEFGWSRVEYNGQTLYCVSSYLRVVE